MLVLKLRYWLDNDSIEHWAISNPHIEVRRDSVLDREYQHAAKIITNSLILFEPFFSYIMIVSICGSSSSYRYIRHGTRRSE